MSASRGRLSLVASANRIVTKTKCDASSRRHIQFGLHLGDSLRLNVKCGSKGGYLERLLTKTRMELPKYRKLRFRHGALGYSFEGAGPEWVGAQKSSISIRLSTFRNCTVLHKRGSQNR